MAKTNKRRAQKAKDREKRVRKQKAAREQREFAQARDARFAARYPQLVIANDNGPTGFVQAVTEWVGANWPRAVTKIPTNMRFFLEMQRERGFQPALDMTRRAVHEAGMDDWGLLVETSINTSIGHLLFEEIPSIQNYIPMADLQVLPVGTDAKHWAIFFRQFSSEPSKHGRIFRSSCKQEVTVDGETLPLGWSRHAIEQTCDRVVPTWRRYAGLGDAYGFVHDCVYFEVVKLWNGVPAVTFYGDCAPGYFSWNYVTEILGKVPEDHVERGRYFFRIGYMPLVKSEEGYWVAKTMLMPGFRGTPEHTTLRNMRMEIMEQRRLLALAHDLDMQHLRDDFDYTVLKWFHAHGHPQVVDLKGVKVMEHTLGIEAA